MKTQTEIATDIQIALNAQAEIVSGQPGKVVRGAMVQATRDAFAKELAAFYTAMDEAEGYQFVGTTEWYREEIGKLFVTGYGVIGYDNIRVVNCWQGLGTAAIVLLNQVGAASFPTLAGGSETTKNQAILSAIQNFVDRNSGLSNSVKNFAIGNRTNQTITVSYQITIKSGYSLSTIQAAITDAVEAYMTTVEDGKVSIARLQAIPDDIEGVSDWTLITPTVSGSNIALNAFAVLVPDVQFV